MLRPIITVAIVAMLSAAVAMPAAGQWRSEEDLLATLQNVDASRFDRSIACKELAVVGTEAAVAPLAALLDNDELSHMARYALEPNPSPQVDAALIAAAKTLEGKHLVGVILSLANRNKPEATDVLVEKLNDADPEVRGAAAHALARIGHVVPGDTMLVEYPAACLVWGKTLAGQGQADAAATLLTKLHNTETAPVHIRLAAMVQAIDLLEADGISLLTAGLQSPDPSVFRMSLRAARLIEPAIAVAPVLAVLENAPTTRQPLLITLLGDLGDPAGLPAVLGAAKDTTASNDVRVAALESLIALGGAEQVPLLLASAGDTNEAVAKQAETTLAALRDANVDAAIVAQLNDQTLRTRVIRQIGQRRIVSAVPTLLTMLDGPDQMEVLAALGETIALEQLNMLGRYLSSSVPEVREAAKRAMHAACYRMPDRDATAEALAVYLRNASPETIQFVMDELRQIGGDKAVEIVGRAALGSDETLKEYSTQALGGWLDTSPAALLLELATVEGTSKYGIRGLRGYIRLARQFAMDEADRMAMCKKALELAQRDDDRLLVLQVLERYPSLEGLRMAVALAQSASLKEAASRGALVIGEGVRGANAEVKALLAQVGLQPMKIEIVQAVYGAGDKTKDVTVTVRQHVSGYPLIILPSSSYNTAFGGDPAPQVPKTLTIDYQIDGKTGRVTLKENEAIVLPVPK